MLLATNVFSFIQEVFTGLGKNATFKIIIEGEIPLQFLKNFVSLDVIREGNILRMVKYEIIEKIQSKKS